MTNKTHSKFVAFSVIAAYLFVAPVTVQADHHEKSKKVIQYSAQVTCGQNPSKLVRVLPGQYATSVNIHNPSNKDLQLSAQLALTFPPADLTAGAVSDRIYFELGAGEAIQLDCQEIPSEFFPDASLPPYVIGFLKIEGNKWLDVQVTYTAGTDSQVQSIDTTKIRGRKVRR